MLFTTGLELFRLLKLFTVCNVPFFLALVIIITTIINITIPTAEPPVATIVPPEELLELL